MKLGMPTLLERPDLAGCAALCRELGFDFIEINMNLPHHALDKLAATHLCALARDEDIELTLHLEERLDPFDYNPLMRAASVETVLRALSVAAEAGIKTTVMHLNDGVYFTLPDKKRYLYKEYPDFYIDALLAFREAVEREAPAAVRLCMENTGWQPFQRAAAALLLKSPAFALCWDVGHDHAAGGNDGAFMAKHAVRVRHMHLHDAMGRHNHMTLGEGEADLSARISFAQEQDIGCVVEVKTIEALRASAVWMRGKGLL